MSARGHEHDVDERTEAALARVDAVATDLEAMVKRLRAEIREVRELRGRMSHQLNDLAAEGETDGQEA